MKNVEALISEAFKVKASEFIELLEKMHWMLKEEKGKVFRNFKVEGGLVKLTDNVKKVIVVGDIHGDIESLTYILKDSGFIERVKDDKSVIIIFLGDYGDRGEYSVEVYYTILWLKTNLQENIVMLRGNHEGPSDLLAYPHDLPYQFKRKFGEKWEEAYSLTLSLFDKMPHAAIINSKYIFLHGGVPSKAEKLEDVAYANQTHPSKNFLEEILWNDPDDDITGVYPSPRGAGFLFGEDVTRKFLEKVNAKVVIRGHEPCLGVKLNHNGKVLTVFSRKGPPYFNTHAAYLEISLVKTFTGYELASMAKLF
ncbi:serine/threonine protein phosphatase [Candidatus Bathyarchaeota archaeon]|nr:MAG: serine/threonine protein phosphatase [Candidatus Bathyarchaeota archaeon]